MSGFQKISDKDIDFLLNNILDKDHLVKKLKNKEILTEDDIAFLWDFCTDVICLELDIDYNPTTLGTEIETLIDKFYFMGENYSKKEQYEGSCGKTAPSS